MSLALIRSALCEQHDMGPQHPEQPARLRVIDEQLQRSGLLQDLILLQPQAASDEQLLRAHPEQLLAELRQRSPREGRVSIDGDTAINPHSLEAATVAAGAGLSALWGILAGDFRRAFCAVRPPGHHAEANLSMGFCLFNSIAITALEALQHPGIERIAILDFDVHHGNGTVDIFRDNEQVMVCSSFQYPFYPGRLQALQRPHIINTPLPAGTDSLPFRHALESQWQPALEAFKPDLLLVSAGFDAHRQDPLAQLALEDEDFAWLGGWLATLANSHCDGRMLSMLEGGYHLEALARSCHAYLAAQLDTPLP